MFNATKGLYQAPDGAPAGSGATPGSAAATAATGEGSRQLRHPLPAGRARGERRRRPRGAFDWAKQGLDTDSMALVNDRQWKGVPDVLTSYRNLEKLMGVPPERSSSCPVIKIPSSHGIGSTIVSVDQRLPLITRSLSPKGIPASSRRRSPRFFMKPDYRRHKSKRSRKSITR
jgi:hypothetical protein